MHPCTSTVFYQLDLEWGRLRDSGRLERALCRWRHTDARLAGLASIEELVGLLADRAADPERQSEVLLALMSVGRSDELALRVVLQRFVPALKSIAGWRRPMCQCEWSGEVVSAGFEVIATYPVERRTSSVAANIVWGVRRRMSSLLAVQQRWRDEIMDDSDASVVAVAGHAERVEQAELLRWAADQVGLGRNAGQLIALTRGNGFEVKELAASAGVPSARLRQRRFRDERRLRQVLVAAC